MQLENRNILQPFSEHIESISVHDSGQMDKIKPVYYKFQIF